MDNLCDVWLVDERKFEGKVKVGRKDFPADKNLVIDCRSSSSPYSLPLKQAGSKRYYAAITFLEFSRQPQPSVLSILEKEASKDAWFWCGRTPLGSRGLAYWKLRERIPLTRLRGKA